MEKKYIAIFVLAMLVAGCVGSEQNDLNKLRSALESDHDLSKKLVNRNRSISSSKIIPFLIEI